MTPNTHLGIDPRLCGTPTTLDTGRAGVRLETVPEMAADARGLVHGGFVFGAADYAAMLCVNDPHVVLGAAESRFVAPVRVGEVVDLEAVQQSASGKKRVVEVAGHVGDRLVFTGVFTTFVLEQHVLDA